MQAQPTEWPDAASPDYFKDDDALSDAQRIWADMASQAVPIQKHVVNTSLLSSWQLIAQSAMFMRNYLFYTQILSPLINTLSSSNHIELMVSL